MTTLATTATTTRTSSLICAQERSYGWGEAEGFRPHEHNRPLIVVVLIVVVVAVVFIFVGVVVAAVVAILFCCLRCCLMLIGESRGEG